MALWGTGYEKARAYLEIEHRGKRLQSFWTEPGAAQQPIKQAVTEAMRGGFTLRVTMVRENRAYLTTHRVEVPWSNKKLTVDLGAFRLEARARPAGDLDGGRYRSATPRRRWPRWWPRSTTSRLDAYLPHDWPAGFGVFRQDGSNLQVQFENMPKQLQQVRGNWQVVPERRADDLPLLPRRHHGQPLGLHVLRRQRRSGSRGGMAMGSARWGSDARNDAKSAALRGVQGRRDAVWQAAWRTGRS